MYSDQSSNPVQAMLWLFLLLLLDYNLNSSCPLSVIWYALEVQSLFPDERPTTDVLDSVWMGDYRRCKKEFLCHAVLANSCALTSPWYLFIPRMPPPPLGSTLNALDTIHLVRLLVIKYIFKSIRNAYPIALEFHSPPPPQHLLLDQEKRTYSWMNLLMMTWTGTKSSVRLFCVCKL